MCYNDYADQRSAQMALRASGFDSLDVEMKPVFGRVQPVVVCERARDAETVMARGFNARLSVEYAAD